MIIWSHNVNEQADMELSILQQSLLSTQNENFIYGSFHCEKFKRGKKCELCSHMRETNFIYSHQYKTKFRIHGHLSHDLSLAPIDKKRWYVYQIEDIPCQKQIIGSTNNMPSLVIQKY